MAIHKHRCQNCGVVFVTTSYWCKTCRESMAEKDKWYLIGFFEYDSQPTSYRDGLEAISAFKLGVLDRVGRFNDVSEGDDGTD